MRHFININQDFRCLHCRAYVTVERAYSAVNNRNHCPYCLWTRDLDLFEAGDRLSACKGGMQPIGLTLKERRKKYARLDQGELMLVHRCVECGKISINRIAADDFAPAVLEVFEFSLHLTAADRTLIAGSRITLLGQDQRTLVRSRLLGNLAEMEDDGTGFSPN